MITTPLLESSMNLVIPSSSAKNPPTNKSQVQTVSIDRAETIRFNNQVVDLGTLTEQLSELKQKNPDVEIVIRPDRELPVQKLIGLMDALQRAGITKLGIATRQPRMNTNRHEGKKRCPRNTRIDANETEIWSARTCPRTPKRLHVAPLPNLCFCSGRRAAL